MLELLGDGEIGLAIELGREAVDFVGESGDGLGRFRRLLCVGIFGIVGIVGSLTVDFQLILQ